MPLYALDGKAPRIAPGAWVAPSAELIGEVIVEEGANIWFGAIIRADNTPIVIGAGSNVQDGSLLHSDPGAPLVIGRDVTIGHKVILHGCTIGDRVLVGMGSTILNGATIAADSLVGANALVTEGKTFPDGSLIVGAPAVVKRALDAAAIASLMVSAEGYRANARRFQAGLLPI